MQEFSWVCFIKRNFSTGEVLLLMFCCGSRQQKFANSQVTRTHTSKISRLMHKKTLGRHTIHREVTTHERGITCKYTSYKYVLNCSNTRIAHRKTQHWYATIYIILGKLKYRRRDIQICAEKKRHFGLGQEAGDSQSIFKIKSLELDTNSTYACVEFAHTHTHPPI